MGTQNKLYFFYTTCFIYYRKSILANYTTFLIQMYAITVRFAVISEERERDPGIRGEHNLQIGGFQQSGGGCKSLLLSQYLFLHFYVDLNLSNGLMDYRTTKFENDANRPSCFQQPVSPYLILNYIL